LMQVLEIFPSEKYTILWNSIVGFTFECQPLITMADFKQKYLSNIFFNCVIFRSKILQKLRIFPKWALQMRHLYFWVS
jgi:hypothetical protein